MKKIERVISAAVKRCIGKDETVCLQLSGGLDSAIIQAVAKLDHLYCATWPEQNNIDLAVIASQGRPVTPVTFSKAEMLEVLPEVARVTDGKGTWSQVCQWFLCKKAKDDGCHVVLTGEGADELFGGYARYRVLYWLDKMYSDPLLKDYQGIVDYMMGPKDEIVEKMLKRTATTYEVLQWTKNKVETPYLVDKISKIETEYCLPSLLKYGAAIAEAHGLECRFPFMDKEVVDFSNELDATEKVIVDYNKYMLRVAASRLGVPSVIIDEKTKKGLFIPQDWAPKDSPRWSRQWFEILMHNAYEE